MTRCRPTWCAVAALLAGAVISQVPAASADASVPLVRVSEDAPLAPPAATSDGRWVATWTAGPVPPSPHGRSAGGFTDQTVRQVLRTSVGGSEVRVRFTNAFGTRPLVVSGADLAAPSAGAGLVTGTDHGLTVDGARTFTVPVGAVVATDPVAVLVGAGADLAVSTWFDGATGPATWHPLALSTGYIATGDHVADSSGAAFGSTTPSWWYLDGVDVLAPPATRAVVAFGASTSDGEGSPTGAHARWVDDLNRRLAGSGTDLAVVDEGIAGNRLLSDSAARAVTTGSRRMPSPSRAWARSSSPRSATTTSATAATSPPPS